MILLGATGLLAAGWSPARASTSEPSGGATLLEGANGSAAGGTGNATVHWSAECPNPTGEKSHYWYVHSTAYHQDGSQANHQSTAESGTTSDSGEHGLALHMAPGLVRETFTVQVELLCFPNPNKIIGNLAITLSRSEGGTSAGGGTGAGGSGGGSGAGGSGSGPAGGGAGGAPGSGGAVRCVVPKLRGKTLANAKRLLERAHCRLGKVTAPRVRRGARLRVHSSSPGQGARLPAGTKVKVALRRA